MQKCGKCKKEKELKCFSKDRSTKSGHANRCKECFRKFNYKYEKKSEILAPGKKRCPRCLKIKELKDFGKSSNTKNGFRKGKCKECRKSEKQNSKRKTEWYKKDKKKNPEKYKEKVKIQNRKRKHAKIHSSLIRKILKGKKKSKNSEILGYAPDDLKNHLEKLWTPGMNWDNYGEWHVDHIIPVSAFPPKTPLNIINSLVNLRPLWKTTRLIDGIEYEGNLNRKKGAPINTENPGRGVMFFDIDGVLVWHYLDEKGHGVPDQAYREPKLLDGVLEKLDEWKDYHIILTTGRAEHKREITEKQLKELGIRYNQLLMGLPSPRYIINDLKPGSFDSMAIAINLKRNRGLKDIDLEMCAQLQALSITYGVNLTIIFD